MKKKGSTHVYEEFTKLSLPSKVVSVVPCDFNTDGNLDILVTYELDSGLHTNQIYLGNRTKFDKTLELPKTKDQFTLLDYHGDLKPTLIGYDETDKLILLENFSSSPVPSTDLSKDGLCKIYQNHSNAFIDLNGDCRADLVLTCIASADMPDIGITANTRYLEFWLNSESGFKVFSKRKALPAGSGPISFSDIDGDGSVDIIFPVCDPPDTCATENAIHIFYNQKKGFCDDKIKCQKKGNICEMADANFDFDFSNLKTQSRVTFLPHLLGS